MRIDIIGSGGKTSLLFALALALQKSGYKVLIETSTKMQIEDFTMVEPENLEERDLWLQKCTNFLEKEGFVMAASKAALKKAGPLSKESAEFLESRADFVLCEADGSKHLPLKYPLPQQEPQVGSKADLILLVTNLSALHQPLKAVLHRYEPACQKFLWNENDPAESFHVQTLIGEYKNRLQEEKMAAPCLICLIEESKEEKTEAENLRAALKAEGYSVIILSKLHLPQKQNGYKREDALNAKSEAVQALAETIKNKQ